MDIYFVVVLSNFFIVIGGQGTGKSYLIRTISKHVEKILRQPGDNPEKPKIILLGPTGMAASVIGK